MKKEKEIKCVIWDLDNTLWDGIILENPSVQPFQHIVECIKTLDERGVLHSIASKNYYDDAIKYLKRFGLDQYFLYPEINWNNKSQSISEIIKNINIGADTVAFVDDQPYELDEVRSVYPDILCIPSKDAWKIIDDDRFKPKHITEDSKMRRSIYMTDMLRNESEKQYKGNSEDFLYSLNMEIIIALAQDHDLDRLVELTERTNQLNTTGYTYSYEELFELSKSQDYKLLVVGLKDKYGSSGKIGLALLKTDTEGWMIELLIMSCRVLTRGIGTILIDFILNKAQSEKCAVYAKFRKTQRNKMMYMTYIMAGFTLRKQQDDIMILEHPLQHVRSLPAYATIHNQTAEFSRKPEAILT